MLRAIVVVALLLPFSAAAPAIAYELNEGLLGITRVPFKVGQTLTADELASQKCTEAGKGLLVCPTVQANKRGFGIMVEKVEGGNRITSVLSYWKCEPALCPDELKATVSALSKQLGAEPELLNGTPIWRDREKNQRDLMVQMIGSSMVSIVLLESHP